MLGREDAAAVLRREHLAAVEHHAEIGGVGYHLDRRMNDPLWWRFAGVLVGAHGTAAEPGKAEVLTHFGQGTAAIDHVSIATHGYREVLQRLRRFRLEWWENVVPELSLWQVFVYDPNCKRR